MALGGPHRSSSVITRSARCRGAESTPHRRLASLRDGRRASVRRLQGESSVYKTQAEALSLFEKGPLALVAGEGFEPSTSGL